MARTNSKPKTELSFAISYGLAGGPSHGKKITRLLEDAGWKQAEQINEADIIIAHSGGCWLVPKTATPRLVTYIGMPLAQSSPRRTWAIAKRAALKKNSIKYNLKGSFQNGYYILRQPRRNLDMIRHAKTAKPIIFPNAQAVFVANRHDPWLKSETLQTYLGKQRWAYISLPDSHDDIWEHPERYAAIINHYARLLA